MILFVIKMIIMIIKIVMMHCNKNNNIMNIVSFLMVDFKNSCYSPVWLRL